MAVAAAERGSEPSTTMCRDLAAANRRAQRTRGLLWGFWEEDVLGRQFHVSENNARRRVELVMRLSHDLVFSQHHQGMKERGTPWELKETKCTGVEANNHCCELAYFPYRPCVSET